MARWFTPYAEEEKAKVVAEVHRLVTSRPLAMSNFLEWTNYRIIYNAYASLYFVACVDLIHFFVEALDAFFGNVCELDLVYNFWKCYAVLDEIVLAGEIMETSKETVLSRLAILESLD
ncbi:AP-2 complex subunit sigma [Thecamonas trahens ATCC 50062]|uniref:AP complex subunit sigma n=1 Tax=Thecamonas trahens ATCC 50062 TaxID=461836 RepID=A0A0L0DRU1_THETB|nr:AP-2 complex subunit sigma [Thecamonas trahens ATCC 50062]KNC54143.1 AP-2 complex subunit sigma [Thecamonas trahens ATCC 50062]|eukprot:XP_013753964.1 AP-2 complex subunit sigma [Thecamonas trahens ATCC 50062]